MQQPKQRFTHFWLRLIRTIRLNPVVFFSASVLLVSCTKLDKNSNCLNDQATCFKADTTRPQFSNSTPAAGQTVSTLDYIDLTFTEELKNPQPSDFSLQSPGNSLSIARVEKLSGHVYRLWMSGAVQNGQIVFGFDQLRDYNGNFASGSLTITGNVDIGITFDKDLVTNPGYREGVSSAGGTAYSSTTIRFKHDYQGDVANGNDWKVYRTTGITACSGPGVTLLGGFGSATLAGETFVSFTLNQAADFPGAEGYYRIVVCINNAAKNKFGAQGLLIARDNSAPSVIINPYSLSDEFRTAQSIGVSCSDNASKIAYRQTSFNTWTGLGTDPADPADPDFTVAGNVDTGGGSVEYTGNVTTPGPSFLGDTINPVRSKYKFRCVDKAGNKSAVSAGTSPVYVIDNTLPEVTISLTGTFRDFITNNIPANNSTTISFTTNQPAGQTYKINKNGTSCDAGGADMVSALTPASGALISHTFSVGAAANQFAVGTHNLRICVRNPANTKWGIATLTVTRDDSVPVVTPNVASGTYGSLQSIELTCSDNKDKLYVTSAEGLGATVPTAPADPALIASEESSGLLSPANDRTTIYKWICRDKAGQVSTVGTAQYTIDTVIPAVTIVSNQYPALSSLASAFQTTNLVFHSTRGGLTYRIMRGTTDCVTTATQIGTDQTVPAAVNGVVPNVTVNPGFADFPSNGTTYNLRVCVYNNAGSVGYNTSTLQITRDDTPPTLPIQTPTITQVDATNFTVSWNASSDSSGIAGYRIFRRLGASVYGASPDYTAVSTSATITMPDAQPYFLKIVPFDVAGNVPAAGASYTEITTKPAITLIVTGLGSAKFFNLTDGTSSATISANTAGMAWTTTLGAGSTYNLAVTTQPVGQVCAVKELQHGTLNANLTINVNCNDGALVGGTFQTRPAAPLNYQLYRGNATTEVARSVAGVSASFVSSGVAITGSGTMFVVDPGTSQIYRLAGGGSLISIAGSGGTGIADGLGAAATFYNPSYMASDGSNLYISQVGNGLGTNTNDGIRKLDSAGNVTTLVSGAAVLDPEGITVSGNMLYWANRRSHEVKSYNLSTGAIAVVAGTNGVAGSGDGTGTSATFNEPMGLTVLNNKLYVTEYGGHRIRIIDIGTQVVTTLAGSTAAEVDGPTSIARFNGPAGITTDGFDLYVIDYIGRTLRRVRLDRMGGTNHFVTTLAGSGASGTANGAGATVTFTGPVAIATNGRQLFISDEGNGMVRKIGDLGLVGYWPVDKGVNPFDYSSDGSAVLNGTLVNGPLSTSTDRFGTANGASLFTNSQYITAAAPITATGIAACNVSMSFWFKMTATTGANQILVYNGNSGNSGFGFYIDPSGVLSFLFGTNGSYPAYSVAPGVWTHAAATCKNSNQWSVYVNGKYLLPVVNNPTATPPATLYIGANSSLIEKLNGAIGDVRVYNRTLNEGEINELAQDAGGTAQVGNSFNTGATGLLSHYPLTGASAADAGSLNNLLTVVSGINVAGIDGDLSGARIFNGSTEFMRTAVAPGLPTGTHPRTLCAWVNPSSYPGAAMMASYGPNVNHQAFGLIMYGSSQIGLSAWNNDVVANATIPLNTWSHICGSYDGSTATIYRNGVALLSAAFGAGFSTVGGNIVIGQNAGPAGSGFFPGKIDDVRIYNNALSTTQIRQLATQVPAGLVLRLDMNGDANDTSGFGHTITSNSGSLTTGRNGTANTAYNFTSGQFIRVGHSAAIMGITDMSWSFWMKTDYVGMDTHILDKYVSSPESGWLIKYNTTDNMHGWMRGISGTNTSSTSHPLRPANIWNHYVYVRSGATMSIYLNGGLISNVQAGDTAAVQQNTASLIVGPSGTGNLALQDVRIYGRAMSASEVRALAGYHPMQVTSWSAVPTSSSLKFFLQPEAATYAAGSCSGGANCVSAWNDSSGNNFNVAQGAAASQPVYNAAGINGKPTVKFVQSAATFLTGTCNMALNSANSTFFSVFQEGNQSGNNGIFQSGTFAPGGGKLIYFIYNPRRGPSLFDLGAGGAGMLNLWDSDPSVTYNISGEAVIMSMDFNGTSGNLYKNGLAVTKSQAASAGYNCGSGALHIGRYYYGGAYPSDGGYFDGHLADFLFFNSILSGISAYGAPYTDREVVQCYLSAKYSIPLGSNVTCP